MPVTTTTLRVDFVSESADYRSTFGWYNKATGIGGILYAEIEAQGSHPTVVAGQSSVEFEVATADLGNIHYFLIADGGGNSQNTDAELNKDIKVVKLSDGTWAVATLDSHGNVEMKNGKPNILIGDGANAFFTEKAKNEGGVDHASSKVGTQQTAATLAGDTADGLTGLIAWEDLVATKNKNGSWSKPGDADYNDAVFNISIVPLANAAPQTNAGSGSGNEDTTIAVALSGTDSDGTVASFRITTLPANGTLYRDAALTQVLATNDVVTASGNTTTVYFKPATNWNGSTTFQYAAIDNGGVQDATPATATIGVAPVNDAAVLSVDVRNLTEANTAAAISTSGTLTISDVDSPAAFVAQPGTAGSYGTFVINAAGFWTYTATSAHDEFVAGTTYTDTFSVASSDGTLTSVTINILGTNDAPVVTGETAAGTEDVDVVLSQASLLANDTDVDGGPLSITGVGNATHGSVAIVGGDVVFTPDADFSGQATFDYWVSDGTATVTGHVALDVAPDADAPVLEVGEMPSGDQTPVAATDEILVATYDPLNPGLGFQHSESGIAPLAGGGFVVVWMARRVDGTGDDARARMYDADGVATTGIIVVSTGGPMSRWPTVTGLDNGGFAAVWADNNAVTVRSYDSAGIQTGNTVMPGIAGVIGASVTKLTNGDFVVTWVEDIGAGELNIYGQRFSAGNVPIGLEFSVVTNTNIQYNPSIGALADGGFVVAWDAYGGQDGSVTGIFAQRFDAAGALVGGAFQVNTTFPGDQTAASVAGLDDGGFVVTWTGPDGSGRGVFGQRYDAAGVADGGEFPVDSNLGTHQERSSVTALPDGGYLAVWQQDTGDVYGQRYDAAGAAVGMAFQVNDVSSGFQPDMFSGVFTATVLTDGTLAVTWYTQSNDPSQVYVRLFDLPGGGATEDNPVTLPTITAMLTDLDGSETLTLVLSGYPAGATFSVGHVDGATWVIDNADDIAGLAATPLVMDPPPDWNGTFTLTVDAVATDTATLSSGTATDTATTTVSFEVSIAPVDEAPIAPLAGGEGAEIVGTAADDNLTGTSGDDLLRGDGGADTLFGGEGDDTFFFALPSDGFDSIIDFESGADVFGIAAAGFGGGLVVGGSVTLVAAADAGVAVGGAGGYFIFDDDGANAGTVYWDESGGTSEDAVAFAIVQAGASLSANDFLIA